MGIEKKKVKMLLLKEVAERINAAPSSVRLWVRQGRFPNATLEDTQVGKVWFIPETDLKQVERKPAGRPRGAKNKNPRKKAKKE